MILSAMAAPKELTEKNLIPKIDSIRSIKNIHNGNLNITLENSSMDSSFSTIKESKINYFTGNLTQKYNAYFTITQEILPSRIKETINISAMPANKDLTMSYKIDTNYTLFLFKNEIFVLDNDRIMGIFRQPFIYDYNHTTKYLNYSLKNKILSYTVPKEIFTTSKYPYVIDPVYDDFSSSSLNASKWIIATHADSGTQAIYSTNQNYKGMASFYGLVYTDGNINGNHGETITLYSKNFTANTTEINITYINLINIIRSAGSSNFIFSLNDLPVYVYSRSGDTPLISYSGYEQYEQPILINYSIRLVRDSLTSPWTAYYRNDNNAWHILLENINAGNPNNISFYMANSHASYGVHYEKFYMDSISYSEMPAVQIPISIQSGCYQSRPDQYTIGDGSVLSNSSCGISYNGYINPTTYGNIYYKFNFPSNTDLTDIIIHYRFGDSSNTTDYDVRSQGGDFLFNHILQNGSLYIEADAHLMADFEASINNWETFNNAFHYLGVNDYPISTDLRYFPYPDYFIGTYQTPNLASESYDNDFYNTFNYYWIDEGHYYNSFCSNENCQPNIDSIYNTAKTAFFYDLSITWIFGNTSISNVTYYNGTCSWDNAFCKNTFYSGGYYYCDIDDVIIPCYACNSNNIGSNISSSQCNQTLNNCVNECNHPNSRGCSGNYTVSTCTLGNDGCYHNTYYTTCPNTLVCHTGNCVYPQDIPVNTTNNDVKIEFPAATKTFLLIIFMVVVFGVFLGLGMAIKQDRLGLIIGFVADFLILIISAIPDFPLIGGIMPAWISISLAILSVLIFIFIMVNKLMGGDK